jgi:hypothetical protein
MPTMNIKMVTNNGRVVKKKLKMFKTLRAIGWI